MSKVIYDFTGNPFVDAGIWAISQWVEKKPSEINKDDLRNIVNDLVYIYFNESWKKKIHSIFPNNPIINPSTKNKEDKYHSFLDDLIENITPLGDYGNCIACGRRNSKKSFYKSEIPLTGSGGLLNYFSFATPGADYCPACALAVQFSPLVMYSCVNLLLMHSNSEKLMEIWSNKAIHQIRRQLESKDFKGCFDEGIKNPKNAIFRIIEMAQRVDERHLLKKECSSVDFYFFTNFIQSPNVEIYHVPAPIFRFLYQANSSEYNEYWIKIIKRGYVGVNWEKVEKENKEYKNNPNKVYNNLLEGRSIIRFFIDRKNKKAIGGWNFFSHYLKEVRNMEEKRIDAIKRVGDELSDYIINMDDIKTLNRLEMANNYRSFRNILRIIIKKRISNGIEDPLFTFDDYVNYLFPEGNLTWRETQDLILFRIYEKSQSWIIQQGKKNELSSEIKEDNLKMEE